MFQIRAQVGKNRLYVTLIDELTDDEARSASEQAIEGMRRLRPGFAVITDVIHLARFSPVGLDELQRAAQVMRELGFGRAIHVVGKSATPAVQLERMARAMGYAANLAFSLEEAEGVLEPAFG